MKQNIAKDEETNAIKIHGDILEAIISCVPLIHLLPAYHVSQDWRCAVTSSLKNSCRVKPWLIAHIQNSRNFSLLVRCVFDHESLVWTEVPCVNEPFTCVPIRSSGSNLLYMLTPSKFSFSLDPLLKAKWHHVQGPKVSRLDPVVAVIGSCILIAGGIYDFEDDPLAVEVYDNKSQQWEICQSMPNFYKDSASTTWLSVAVSDKKMFLLEKSSGTFCTFDPEMKLWGDTFALKPNGSIFFSLIGFSNNRLLLIGLIGNTENVESLKIWEVNCDTFICNEVGEMPSKMLEKFIDSCSSPSSINISMAEDMIYIYNSENPKVIIHCEISKCSSCYWGTIQNSIVNDQNEMHRFTFTCSRVGINDLQKAFGLLGTRF
ncbi:F-box/kelch-repeat protein [Thalictrum thalictroides]|uniref:F-box/kelch-repeat protein n=1 Tax=Thalictrum thalictroides TaxID=46969 RepID=A0A7J6WN68_THATH|nr:F-box/kelch-repeat protein [Thalictrum thalictroides]